MALQVRVSHAVLELYSRLKSQSMPSLACEHIHPAFAKL